MGKCMQCKMHCEHGLIKTTYLEPPIRNALLCIIEIKSTTNGLYIHISFNQLYTLNTRKKLIDPNEIAILRDEPAKFIFTKVQVKRARDARGTRDRMKNARIVHVYVLNKIYSSLSRYLNTKINKLCAAFTRAISHGLLNCQHIEAFTLFNISIRSHRAFSLNIRFALDFRCILLLNAVQFPF